MDHSPAPKRDHWTPFTQLDGSFLQGEHHAPALWSRPPSPFVWQLGRRLLLLDEEAAEWVFAELEFIPSICRYAEIRRSRFAMEREAVGVLLSRALADGMPSVQDAAASLDAWLQNSYGHSLRESGTRVRSRIG